VDRDLLAYLRGLEWAGAGSTATLAILTGPAPPPAPAAFNPSSSAFSPSPFSSSSSMDEEEKVAGSEASGQPSRGGRRLVVANVGDSHAVLCRGGRAVTLTRAHRVHGRGQDVEVRGKGGYTVFPTPVDVAKGRASARVGYTYLVLIYIIYSTHCPLSFYLMLKKQDEVLRVVGTRGWVSRGRVCSIIAVSRALGDLKFKGQDPEGLLRDLRQLPILPEYLAASGEWRHCVYIGGEKGGGPALL
jgi:hypothetical protein